MKSRVVVKYSAAPLPSSYALLQEKTDLKLPPANWLRENAQLGTAGTTVLGSSRKSKPFSRYHYYFTFICMYLADAFILSDLRSISVAFPGNQTHDLGIVSVMLCCLSYRKDHIILHSVLHFKSITLYNTFNVNVYI